MAGKKTDPLLLEPAGAGGIYLVQQGDNLTTIANRHAQSTLAEPHNAIQQILDDNPHITNANLIYPGQPIFLRSRGALARSFSPALRDDITSAIKTLQSASGPEMSALVRNSDAVSLVLATPENLAKEFSKLVSSNQRALNELIQQHRRYRAAGVTAAGYREFSRSRNTVLEQIQRELGKTAKPLLGTTPKQATALRPGRSANPTAALSQSAGRLSTAAKAMKVGGHVLKAADVVISLEVTRQEVCTAETRQLKNEQFVGGIGSIAGGFGGSIAGGALGGAIVAVALGSNPAGWAVLLVVVTASTAGGFIGSKLGRSGSKTVYNQFGKGYDIVDIAQVEALCP
ncbi:MAG: LysM peptidoglycan-binding domain-containing protein [Planctomycetaceae bacterium]|nr:LysM peptidoglycan-binding domain-containing protein [Planctomycetaceae bacterium]